MQWGVSGSFGGGEYSSSIKFYIPFPTKCLTILTTPQQANGGVVSYVSDFDLQILNITKEKFTFFNQRYAEGGYSLKYRWLAIGY